MTERRPRSRCRGPYTPPHRKQAEGLDPCASRSLDELHSLSLQVELVPFQLIEGCPFAHLFRRDSASITVPDEDDSKLELLRWFSESLTRWQAKPQLPSIRPCLILPSSLSKQARAWWHHQVKSVGLSSESQGFGELRQIHILPAGNVQEATPPQPIPESNSNCVEASRNPELAKQIYGWCQEEGPTYWRYSHSEIRQMLGLGHALPPDIQQLMTKRKQSQQLAEHMAAGQTEAAIALLVANPQLAWLKDGQTGNYPIHTACKLGNAVVVRYLASQPGILEQRGSQRRLPLTIARSSHHQDIVQLLTKQGASEI